MSDEQGSKPREIGDYMFLAGDLHGIHLSDCLKGDEILVHTAFSIYRLSVLNPGEKIVRAHGFKARHMQLPERACVGGISLSGTGSMSIPGFLSVGYRCRIGSLLTSQITLLYHNGERHSPIVALQ